MPLYPQAAEIVVAPAGSSKAVVADYVCDGTADQVEINLAIARAATIGGATVRLLPGTFTIAAPIVISAAQDNVSLLGSGAGATTINGVLGDGVWHLHLNTLNQGDILRNFTLSNLTINAAGRSSNTLQGGGIIVQDGQGQIVNLTIRDIELYGAELAQRCHGISFYYASGTAHDVNENITIERVNIYNLTNATAFYGVLMQHETDGFSLSNIVVRAVSAASQAVYNMIAVYAGSRNGVIDKCDAQVVGEGHSVFAISAGSNIRISNNYAKMTIGVVGDEVSTFSEGGFEFESTSGHSSTPNNQTFNVQSINNIAEITSGPGFLVRTIGGATVPQYIHSLGDKAKNCTVGFLFQHGTNLSLAGQSTPGCSTAVTRAGGVTFDGFDTETAARVYGGSAIVTPIATTAIVNAAGVHLPNETGLYCSNSTGTAYRLMLRRTSNNFLAIKGGTSQDLIVGDTGNRLGLGPANPDPANIDGVVGAVVIYNGTASTGVTSTTIRAGAGQSTSPLLTVEANDGTNIVIVHSGGVTIGGGATASELKFLEPSGSGTNYTAFKAQAQSADVTYTLPAAVAGTNGDVLACTTGGVLSWTTIASGDTPGGSGTEIQYRAGASTLGAVTGSSVSSTSITLTGNVTAAQHNIDVNNYVWADSGRLAFKANGTDGILFANTDYAAFFRHFIVQPPGGADAMLILGAVSASETCLKGVGTTVQIRTGDDSAYAAAECAQLSTHNHYPLTDDTYYLGKNDDDSPKAWKGLILKDQSDGKYYRYHSINGVLTAVDLTD